MPPPPQDCTLQVTLNKGEAAYTHDIYLDGPTPDLLVANDKLHVGEISRRYWDGVSALRFFIKVYPSSGPIYNVYSDSSWAKNTMMDDDSNLIVFEDIPNSHSDRDYNDVMIAVERVNCGPGNNLPPPQPGVTPPPSEPPVPVPDPAPVVLPPPDVAPDPNPTPAPEPAPNPDPGADPNPTPTPDPTPVPDPEPGTTTPDPLPPPTPIIVPPGGATKVHVNFLEATFKVGDLYLAGDPPELLIAKGSNKKGASARNFFAAGESLVFFLRADGTDYYSDDPESARVDFITDFNWRIYIDTNFDGDFNDVIVHVVLTPPNK